MTQLAAPEQPAAEVSGEPDAQLKEARLTNSLLRNLCASLDAHQDAAERQLAMSRETKALLQELVQRVNGVQASLVQFQSRRNAANTQAAMTLIARAQDAFSTLSNTILVLALSEDLD